MTITLELWEIATIAILFILAIAIAIAMWICAKEAEELLQRSKNIRVVNMQSENRHVNDLYKQIAHLTDLCAAMAKAIYFNTRNYKTIYKTCGITEGERNCWKNITGDYEK